MKKSILVALVLIVSQIAIVAQCNVIICNEAVSIALDDDGIALLHAGIIDEGSYDDCELQLALFDSDNVVELIPYGDTIMVNCDHVGDIVLRMRDVNTLNECWASAVIVDEQNLCISSIKETAEADFTARYSNGTIEVLLPDNLEAIIHIYNIVGKTVASKRITKQNNIIRFPEALQNGTYIVSAKINGIVSSKKIVVW